MRIQEKDQLLLVFPYYSFVLVLYKIKDSKLTAYFSVSAASPGNTLPSRSSIDAPPPVEIHENLSARPRLIAAAA